MKKINVLVTGGNGQLGCALRAASAGSGNHYIFSDINSLPGMETLYLDVTNSEGVEIVCDSENVDVIVNCAAYTNVDKAEDDTAFAAVLNRDVPATLAAVARSRKATLIQISTDYIFAGDASTPIPEDAQPGPLSVYGATKLAGEKAVRDSACNSIIIRTAWLYSQYGRNFVKTIRRLTSERDSLKVVCDQVGTPTLADDLAEFIVDIIDGGKIGKTGTYNFTDEGVCSWYDFAHEICAMAGNRCEITPCNSVEYPQKARRPSYSVLDKSLVKKTFGIVIPYWRDSLAKCMTQIERNGD